MTLIPRPGILDIAPYQGGGSKIAGFDHVIKLASNEGALGPSPRAMAAYRALAETMHRYPDGHSIALREAIGARYSIDAARIVCGAGSDELIALLVRSFAGPGDEVLYSRYGFLMYAIAAKGCGATPVAADETEDLTASVDKLLAAVTDKTRVVFLANPNNPTGTYLPVSEVRRLRDGLPAHVLLVLDAAYAEFVSRNDYAPGIELVDSYDNVVMMRTFSKIYGMGGIRLGWAYCPEGVADILNRIRGPFNVSAPAIAAGVAAIEDLEFEGLARRHNDYWLQWFSDEVTKMGLSFVPSVCNFLLVRFADAPGRNAAAADAFLKSKGIIVRAMASYGLPQYLRITIGPSDEMTALVSALKEFQGGVMDEVFFDKVCVIGIGHIGSSLVRVIRKFKLAGRVVALDSNPEHRACALDLGIVDEASADPASMVRDADLVVFSVPLGAYAEVAATIAPYLKEGAIVTDVGSVKVAAIRDIAPHLPQGVHFVPGHPIAGTEHSGPAAGFPELFENRWCILTPPEGTAPEAVAKVKAIWAKAGSMIEVMDPEYHDRVLAVTSHLPHLIAYTIVGTATDLESSLQQEVIKFSASGFRDFTRIAASDPVMWRDIFLNNREAVLDVIQRFTEDLTALQRAIRWGEGDKLLDLFTRTRAIRRSIIDARQA